MARITKARERSGEASMLSAKEEAFLEKRARLARWWNVAALGMLAVLAGIALWLYLKSPRLISPGRVLADLEAGTLPVETAETMAVLLPVLVLMCLVIVAVVVFYGFFVFSNERRYHDIIAKLKRGE